MDDEAPRSESENRTHGAKKIGPSQYFDFFDRIGHVWTAPWQELSDVSAALVGCGHVSGLLMRPVWPLALMLCADRVPIHHTHSSMR